MMKQVPIWMTEKQIKYMRVYALTHKISFNEAVRIAVERLETSERKEEIKRAKVKRG